MITVTNGKQTGFLGKDKIYIGRANPYYNLPESPLHNPFKINIHYSREQVIKLYRQYLWNSIKQMKNSGKVDEIMLELIRIVRQERQENIILVCYCKPLSCHGDIIVNALNWLKTQSWFLQALV